MVCGSRVRRNIRSLGSFAHQRSTLLPICVPTLLCLCLAPYALHLEPRPILSLASPPLLLYHSATHTNTLSVPVSRADDDSHGPGGAVSMSAHSNHTSTPFFLTAQDCSFPALAKGGTGDLGIAGTALVAQFCSKRDAIGRQSSGVHWRQRFGHKHVKAIAIDTHVLDQGGRGVWTPMDAL
jgi:hypothetical protein